MDTKRFDTLTRAISTRFSRRAAIRQGGATLIGTTAAISGLHAAAQQATPAAGAEASFLFVQNFGGGSIEPHPGETDRFLLTLTDAPASTISFAERPSRLTNSVPTERLPSVLSFDPANPPNAALVARTTDGDELTVIIELLDPAYDAASRTVTYSIRELADYVSLGADLAASAQPLGELPASFGLASLFIDSSSGCRDYLQYCSSNGDCCQNACVQGKFIPDDPSQSSASYYGFSMCMPPPN